jgi:hypothetical protein
MSNWVVHRDLASYQAGASDSALSRSKYRRHSTDGHKTGEDELRRLSALHPNAILVRENYGETVVMSAKDLPEAS